MSAVVILNVPATGTGTPSDVSSFGGNKTIVTDGTMLPGEQLVIEASEDPTGTLEANRTYNGVITIDSNFPGKVTIDVVANTMRVVRYFPMGTTPSLTITGETGTQTFAALNIPVITAPAGGVADGTPLNVSAFGSLLSIAINGTFIDGENLLIMGSLDNVIYDGIFSVNNGYPGLHTFTANYNWLKVRRSGRPSVNTLTSAVGGSTSGGSGPGPGSGTLQFDSINIVGTKLAAFVTTGFLKGTIAYVGNDTFPGHGSVHRNYQLVYGEALTADGIEVVNSPTFGVDGAQWQSLDTVNQQALQKRFWAVDPANISGIANDENNGFGTSLANAKLFPLRTFQELNRRLVGYNGNNTTQIALMSSDTNTPVMNNLKGENGNDQVAIIGDLVQLGGDYAVGYYLTEIPGSNLSFFLIAPGLGALGNNGKLVTNDTFTKWAMIQNVDGANQAELTQPHNYNPFTFGGSLNVAFAPGDTVRVWNMPSLSQWPFTPRMQFPTVWHAQINGSRTPPANFDQNLFGTSGPQIVACICDGWQTNGGSSGLMVGCQFSGNGSNFIGPQSMNLTNCGIRNVIFQQVGGNVQVNGTLNLNGAAAKYILANNGTLNATSTGQLAAFACASVAAFDVGKGSTLSVSATSALYGNIGAIPVILARSNSNISLTKALCTALTAAAHPLLSNIVNYDYADLPISDDPDGIFWSVN